MADVSYFKPINVKVAGLLNDSYLITWDISDVAKSLLETEYALLPEYIIRGTNIETSSVEDIIIITSNRYPMTGAVPRGYTNVFVVAVIDGNESDPSNTITLVSNNVASGDSIVAVGTDENGIPRTLSVTQDGVLKVTGTTVNNYGGDASAANQQTAISKLDDIKTAQDATTSSVNNVVTKLSSVGLDNATVTALSEVTVTNFPSDYPASETVSKLEDLILAVAKEATLNTLSGKVDSLVKTTDLPIVNNEVMSSVSNFPTDFPDVNTKNSVDNVNNTLVNLIASNQDDVKNSLQGIWQNTNSASSTLSDIHTGLNTSNGTIQNILDKDTEINNNILNLVSGSNTLIDNSSALIDLLTNLQNLADVTVDSNALTVLQSNIPTNYPDIAAHDLLTNIYAKLEELRTSTKEVILSDITQGLNLGNVVISQSVLPQGAATEQTLSNLLSRINTISSESESIRAMIESLEGYVNDIYQLMDSERLDVLYNSTTPFSCAGTKIFIPELHLTDVLLEIAFLVDDLSSYAAQDQYAKDYSIKFQKNYEGFYYDIYEDYIKRMFLNEIFIQRLPTADNLIIAIDALRYLDIPAEKNPRIQVIVRKYT